MDNKELDTLKKTLEFLKEYQTNWRWMSWNTQVDISYVIMDLDKIITKEEGKKNVA